jgi:Holliday junction resolvase|tara:strand:- start:568 stop:867 length:300 start_codon:yes stop_codon:yes gene_type:complete
MNRKQKGARSERKTMDYLEARGYYCTKSAGSLGEWDIIGVSEDGVVLVQVKSNNWPRPPEMERLYAFPSPEGCTRYIHRWDDRKPEPQIMNLEKRKHDD